MLSDSSSSSSATYSSILAGKIDLDGKIAKPNKTKGILRFVTSENGTRQIQWYNRETSCVEDKWILVTDTYLEKVNQVKTGKVYVLRFPYNKEEKPLFWIQESDEAKEEEFVKTFNEAMSTQKSISHSNTTNQLDLGKPSIKINLSSVLTSERLLSLIEDKQAADELLNYLPSQQQDLENLREIIRSPQLKASIKLFNEVIYQSQNIRALFLSLELDPPTEDEIDTSNSLFLLIKALVKKYGNAEYK